MVKLGMIGYNEGNGHPFSFSSIINGYDQDMMAKSPYPVIIKYLSERNNDEFGIGDIKVTHIWTPDISISRSIAKATFIPSIANSYQELINKVDAVIIARDDVDSHFELAQFFLEHGLFVFVDKPLCANLEQLGYFMPYIELGKLMSCSGLRYHPDIISCFNDELKVKDICFVNTFSVLDWKKYGIHVLEAITPIIGYNITNISNLNDENNYIVKIDYASKIYVLIQINNNCKCPMHAEFYTTTRSYKTIFDQNFICFKRMLISFYEMIIHKKIPINPKETYCIVKAIIDGE